jgi:hypothetical protein
VQNTQTFYFPADGSRVLTGMCGDGQFRANLVDDERSHIRGVGHTRLAAIADLNDALDRAEADGEEEFAEAAE